MSSDAFLGHRLTYEFGALTREALNVDPIRQLQRWLHDAETHGAIEPSAMALATADAEGRPHVRMVLLRYLENGDLIFFTNYESDKGRQLETNPNASVCFWWPTTERQVRVEGVIEPIAPEASKAYFASRPYESQLASAASPQSRPVAEGELEANMAALRAQYPQGLPCPDHWGGYRLIPSRFEFWQGRPARNHDRFVYARTGAAWDVFRIAP